MHAYRRYSQEFSGHDSHHSHYESPFRKVHVKPSVCQSILASFLRLSVQLDDFLSRHPSFLAFIRLVCLLSFLFLLLLSLGDVYHWLRHRRRRDEFSRDGSVEESVSGGKDWVRRHAFMEAGSTMTDEDSEKDALERRRDDTTLVLRGARHPSSLLCVPAEPVPLATEGT